MSSTTFVSLGDPQLFRDQKYGKGSRAAANSALNSALNSLPATAWPTPSQVPSSTLDPALAGTGIGRVSATFIAGDLCQDGGDYSSWDQFFRPPVTGFGGSELKAVRALYQRGVNTTGSDWTDEQRSLTPLTLSPVYFNLGNHDTQSEFTPSAGWWEDGTFSESSDFWRYQMYSFIGQMHSTIRYNGFRNPLWPVAAIDADGERSYTWPENSFNYRVNLGPVTVFNVHVYGGCDPGGSNNSGNLTPGLIWLSDQLQTLKPGSPVMIVQHDTFMADEMVKATPAWTRAQRDLFLRLLAPYNVVGFMVGHVHNVNSSKSPQIVDQLPPELTGRTFYNFRPGAAFSQAFAVYRIDDDPTSGRAQLHVAMATVANGSVAWNMAASLSIETTDASRPLDVLVHLEGSGDQVFQAGQLAGTVGQSRRLEGFQLDFEQPAPPANIRLEYMAHLEGSGDTPWFTDGQFCGTRDQSRRLEGFAINVVGPDAAKWSVSYMAHLENVGNTAFCHDGQFCGTRGQSLRVEAMLVRLLPVSP